MKSLKFLATTLCLAFQLALLPGTQIEAAAAPHLVSGQCTLDNVNHLTSEINWYQSLPQAENAARSQGKMILWMHMLGNLSGAT